ncbi:hypothetical protein JCM10207_008700 [Rhodosporidiobolus poonsookiae]
MAYPPLRYPPVTAEAAPSHPEQRTPPREPTRSASDKEPGPATQPTLEPVNKKHTVRSPFKPPSFLSPPRSSSSPSSSPFSLAFDRKPHSLPTAATSKRGETRPPFFDDADALRPSEHGGTSLVDPETAFWDTTKRRPLFQ